MPIVGYCHECAEWVWVAEDWSCPKGHAAPYVNGWHDSETGEPASPGQAAGRPTPPGQDTPAPAPVVDASGTRVGFLADLSAAFAQSPSYSAAWGTDTDMTVASNPVDAMWGTGKDRTQYTGALKVSEADHVVCFWEQLTEQASGLALGAKDTGAAAGSGVGMGSASCEWGYGTTRAVVEEVAARHGFTVRAVLSRREATW